MYCRYMRRMLQCFFTKTFSFQQQFSPFARYGHMEFFVTYASAVACRFQKDFFLGLAPYLLIVHQIADTAHASYLQVS